jgi:hypothetical protein
MIALQTRPHSARLRHVVAVAVVCLGLAALVACDEAPLVAPTQSTVSVFVTPNVVPLNGTADVTATVIEPAGTAVQDGTLVTFTTTLGSFDPPEARTNNGKVTVKYLAGGVSGTAKIGAFSGGAKATDVEIKVGGAAATKISVGASPGTLPSTGGTTQILAIVTDDSNNRQPLVPVSFTTTAGTLSATSVSTDTNGEARVQLTTTRAADVTATAGSASGKVSITMNAPLGITITPPASLQANTPASFTIGVTASSGSVVRDVNVNWGDGTSTSLSALTGSTSVSHTFLTAGSYTVTVTATDTNGEKTSASTSVTVVPVQVNITLTGPGSAKTKDTVTFTVTVTPTTLPVVRYRFNFGDGQATSIIEKVSTATSITQQYSYQTPLVGSASYTVTVEVTTTTNETYTAQAVITVTAT